MVLNPSLTKYKVQSQLLMTQSKGRRHWDGNPQKLDEGMPCYVAGQQAMWLHRI